MTSRLLRATSLMAGVLLLAGCAAGSAPSPTPSRPVPSAPATPLAFTFAPLTGALVPAGSLQRPALSVKVDNHEDARPQFALNETDIVFEELVEGGLTRYVAVWHSQLPDEVGPVRSIRPMDPDIIAPLGGIVSYSGGQARFTQMMRDTGLVNISADATDDFFFRTDARDAPHNELLKAREAVATQAALAPPPPQFAFGSRSQVGAAPADVANRLDLSFSSASDRAWDWDAATGFWLRSQGGVADTVDGGERTRATNVLVAVVNIDWTYSPVPKTIMIGSGEALLAVDGKVIRGSWSKASQTAPMVFSRPDGTPIRLLPGNTWVELVPATGEVTVR